MSRAENTRSFTRTLTGGFRKLALAAVLVAAPAMAQAPAAAPAAPAAAASAPAISAPGAARAPDVVTRATDTAAGASAGAATAAVPAAAVPAAGGGYTPMAPTAGKGQPVDGGWTFQDQYSPIGEYALWMHDAILVPLITVISLFVLILLLVVMVRFRRGRNQTPSKTTHNAMIEVVWTLLPVLILVGVAVPSIKLLAKQYKPAPANALTVKATGNQWFWSYSYPDNGGLEIVSNMLPDEEAIKRGEPAQLGVDNRMVLPVGEPIRLQTTGADVIHSFAVPSLWFKLDAVPGRINEKVLFIKEPGVYYGQCSELCGARHGYMPIAIEALPRPQFDAWVLAKGGSLKSAKPAEAAAAVPAPAAAPAAAASPAASPTSGASPAAAGASPAPTASGAPAPAA
ncbi:cytochrome c oxidase subunit II [Novosphingobium tardum]|uniref:Cytochrome c oxidase subunit 2 n=1 Tax=Novosphingobium tardum TaxID=1538021 RepID=A0ABV8RN86_9SPHN